MGSDQVKVGLEIFVLGKSVVDKSMVLTMLLCAEKGRRARVAWANGNLWTDAPRRRIMQPNDPSVRHSQTRMG